MISNIKVLLVIGVVANYGKVLNGQKDLRKFFFYQSQTTLPQEINFPKVLKRPRYSLSFLASQIVLNHKTIIFYSPTLA